MYNFVHFEFAFDLSEADIDSKLVKDRYYNSII